MGAAVRPWRAPSLFATLEASNDDPRFPVSGDGPVAEPGERGDRDGGLAGRHRPPPRPRAVDQTQAAG